MNKSSVWSRMGHWFKGPAGSDSPPARTASTSTLGIPTETDPASPPQPNGPEPNVLAAPVSLFRRSRGSGQFERLELEYSRVAKLMDAIQEHLASQGDRSERMARSLDRLADAQSSLPEIASKQLDLLTSIGDQLETQAAHSRQVEQDLSQLPQLADAQRETMVSIGHQLDQARQVDEQVASAISGVQEAVTGLGSVTETSTQVLKEIRRDAGSRDDALAKLLEEQSRKLMLCVWSAIGLAAVASVVGLIAILR